MNQLDNIEECLKKTTARGSTVTVNFELYKSQSANERKQLEQLLNNGNKQVYPGTTRVSEIKTEFENLINQKIIMICERFVPSPLDTLGDILQTVQKQELTFQLSFQVVTG